MPDVLNLSGAAHRDFFRLDAVTQARVKERLRVVLEDPFSPASKALVGMKGVRSARIGDWRIIYSCDAIETPVGPLKTISVSRIKHRKDVYRDL